MSELFGIFQEIKSLLGDRIEEYGIYEDIFSKVYTNLDAVTKEIEYYAENAYCTGKRILEIACGDGSSYMIPLARKGFQVDGVELSKSMIERYEENVKPLPDKIKKRLHVIEGDIFEYETEETYDLIILPSTTICLLTDDLEKTKLLFRKISVWLSENGRFMFDYRRDQHLGNTYETELMSQCNETDRYFMLMQEFNNYIPGKSVVNMYVESFSDGKERKCIASSEKVIITDELVNELIASANFEVHNKYEINCQGAQIRLLVIKKIGEDDSGQ